MLENHIYEISPKVKGRSTVTTPERRDAQISVNVRREPKGGDPSIVNLGHYQEG